MCDFTEEDIILYAFDPAGVETRSGETLGEDAQQSAVVRAHLASGCPDCAGRYASAQATLGLYALSAKPEAVSAYPKSRLDRLIDLETEQAGPQALGGAERAGLKLTGSLDDREAVPARRMWFVPTALAACLGAAITAGLIYPKLTASRQAATGLTASLASASSELSAAKSMLFGSQSALTSAQTALADATKHTAEAVATSEKLSNERDTYKTQLAAFVEADKAQRMMWSKQLVVLDLPGTGTDPAAKARLLVDLQNKAWKLYAMDLKPMPGRQYEFWLIRADGVKVPMGSVKLDEDGKGILGDTVNGPMPQLAAAAISDEPLGSPVVQPTSDLHVLGKFQ